MGTKDRRIALVHGNLEEKVGNKRYELQRAWLPRGEEDGEVLDVRAPGNQALALDDCADMIIQELGTVSLIPDARRVVVVHDLGDFRKGGAKPAAAKPGAKRAKKESAARGWPMLQDWIEQNLAQTNSFLLFAFNEDEDKRRYLDKQSELYQYCQRHADIFEFNEARVDWQFEDAVLAGDLGKSLALLREWAGRGGSPAFRVVQTFNRLVQWLLQARLREEASERGEDARGISIGGKSDRLSFDDLPPFKQKKVSARARQLPPSRLHRALESLNAAQKAFFPTGEERIVPDPWEILEQALVELLAPAPS